ncbi:Uu.00g143350.m01.CDS01 [Anthostomella pinea]|uniref:Uu.00g143350.m01.CDS01 n=1 Tax=Anthostomella pinea TaxID=933095 RepID=A0AAI8VRA9_9PEZI|nr:Uu.00g143350.m01.CDS01 [Anthostomella pinea]
MAALQWTALSAAPTVLLALAIIMPIIMVVNLTRRLFSNASLPNSLPWVGTGHYTGIRGRAKANLSSVLNLRGLLDEGYTKYSKNGQTYVLPYFINGPQVILPMSQIGWLLEQPDDVLSQEQVNRQFLQADYTFLHANLVNDPVHPEIIHHQLTKKINSFADDIADEMRASLEDNWGTDTEAWREVDVYDTMRDVTTRLSTRVFMGLPLCRNRRFLTACSSFIRQVVLAAAAISLFPEVLKPVVAPVFTLYDYIQYRRCSTYLMPIIRERLDRLRDTDKPTLGESKSPNDYVQWAIDHALAKPVVNPMELDPRVIACRFSVLSFAAIQSSVITLTNTLFDLAASPMCTATLSQLHDEVAREIGAASTSNTTTTTSTTTTTPSSSTWSKPTLSRLTHTDSALRESLRLNGFIERGIMKMVVAPGGVTLPDGSHIPRGTKVGVSGYCVHHDDDVYTDALRYDAFRFARDSTGGGGGGGGKKPPWGLVNTSETFMGFSHGLHACPGRFFAANQLKTALGHIALLYEIEPIPERPVNKWFFGHIAPPLGEKLRIRRRKS